MWREVVFQMGNFTLNSGKKAKWKIECDTLTKEDWEGLAAIAVERIPAFSAVEGIPRGGIPFADALRPYATSGPLLIADDVFTTGGSIMRFRKDRDAIAVVAFARELCIHPWIHVLFQLSPFVEPL
jgi:orotate phosphoribosyltransferase